MLKFQWAREHGCDSVNWHLTPAFTDASQGGADRKILSTFFSIMVTFFVLLFLLLFFFRLDANKPMRYLENKAALNEALERLNWPISLKELSLLENEILAGKMYVQQAMELQEAARKENYVSRAPAEVSTLDASVFPSSLLSRVSAVPVHAGFPLSPTPPHRLLKQ